MMLVSFCNIDVC